MTLKAAAASVAISSTPLPLLAWEPSVSCLPSLPGVYWFLDAKDNVLYVGKAKNLKKRVNSYRQLKRLSTDKQRLVKTAKQLKFQTLNSELEALLIEAELIRTHQPSFNILLKDDKSPIYIHLSRDKFPQISTIRKKELNKLVNKGTVIGPFPSAYKLKEILNIARKIFPWCNQAKSGKACFYYHLKQCPGACINQISELEYQENIKQLILFLKGKSKDVLKQLKNQIKLEAEKQNYEKAAILRDRLNLIKEVTSPQFRLKPDVTLPQLKTLFEEEALTQLSKLLADYLKLPLGYQLKRIEGYDVSNTSGQLASVSMVVFINGKADKSEYKLFNIKTLNTPNDYQMMKEAVIRRQNHPEWGTADLMLIDGGKGQLRAALSVWQGSAKIVSLAKNPDRLVIPVINNQESKIQNLKYDILRLSSNHPALKLLQRVRDESHRFSQFGHKRRRLKNLFK